MAYNKETGMYEGFIYKIWNDVNNKIYIGQTKTTLKERWHGHMSSALNEHRYKSHLYNAMRKYGRDKFHIEEIDKMECSTYEELSLELDMLEILRIKEYDSYDYTGKGYNYEFGGTGKTKKNPGKQVCKYDDDLNLLDQYISISEAARMNNIDNATIWAVCRHYYYRAAGFVWAYLGEDPIKPPVHEKKVVPPKKEKIKKDPKPLVKKPTEEEVRITRLEKFGWNGQKIIQYNAFAEIIGIFDDPIEASKKIPISLNELKKNLNGDNLKYYNTVIRYEDMPFDYYPTSPKLQPVVLYDLQGNYIDRFETHRSAEKYLGVPSGEITKVLKRGGSVKNHLVSEYGKDIKRKLKRLEKTYEMLSEDYEVIRTFSKASEIAEMFGVVDCSQSLRKAIQTGKLYRGYYWRYKEEFPINA